MKAEVVNNNVKKMVACAALTFTLAGIALGVAVVWTDDADRMIITAFVVGLGGTMYCVIMFTSLPDDDFTMKAWLERGGVNPVWWSAVGVAALALALGLVAIWAEDGSNLAVSAIAVFVAGTIASAAGAHQRDCATRAETAGNLLLISTSVLAAAIVISATLFLPDLSGPLFWTAAGVGAGGVVVRIAIFFEM